jgi:hypothetical protein
MNNKSIFENAIDSIELLEPDDQEIAIDIIKHRLIEKRRKEIIESIKQARIDYKDGNVKRGTVEELFKDAGV